MPRPQCLVRLWIVAVAMRSVAEANEAFYLIDERFAMFSGRRAEHSAWLVAARVADEDGRCR